jgi:hypothetical protein
MFGVHETNQSKMETQSVTIKVLGPCSIKNSRYPLQCGDCVTTFHPNKLFKVTKFTPDGEKDMLMCQDCIDMYQY